MKKITELFIKRDSSGREIERSQKNIDKQNPDELEILREETVSVCEHCGHPLEDPALQRRCYVCGRTRCMFCTILCQCKRHVCSDCAVSGVQNGLCPDCHQAVMNETNTQNLFKFEKIHFERRISLIKQKLQISHHTDSGNSRLMQKMKSFKSAKLLKELEELEQQYKRLPKP